MLELKATVAETIKNHCDLIYVSSCIQQISHQVYMALANKDVEKYLELSITLDDMTDDLSDLTKKHLSVIGELRLSAAIELNNILADN